jgi:hypothetical protein
LDAELAYAGAEPEEGETEDGAEQSHVVSGWGVAQVEIVGIVYAKGVSTWMVRQWSRATTVSTAVNRLTLEMEANQHRFSSLVPNTSVVGTVTVNQYGIVTVNQNDSAVIHLSVHPILQQVLT